LTNLHRIVVCGFGSIGRRHTANLRKLLPNAQITVFRQHNRETSASDLPKAQVNIVYSLEDALAAKPEAVLICNPAPFHVSTAQNFAEAGAHIFMEKPVSDSLEGLDHLIETCTQRKLVFFVAYPLRFDSALSEMRDAILSGEIGRPLLINATVGQYLPDWRPDQDYRQGVSAQKALGGGALLELSHELDYVQWIMGDVTSVAAKLSRDSDLEIDVEDTVDLSLDFKSGATGSVHLDMTRKSPIRTCTVSGTQGTAEWDGLESTARIKLNETAEWRWLSPKTQNSNAKYISELSHFLACVRGDETVATSGIAGKRTLELILAARESSKTGKAVAL
jgi:predicted dehydrogenase